MKTMLKSLAGVPAEPVRTVLGGRLVVAQRLRCAGT